MKLVLPYPPTVNHYWGQRGKIRFLTAKAKKFRQEVVDIVEELGYDNDVDGDLEMRVKLIPPDRRKRDIDNTLKPILDALEHADVYINDAQIVRLVVNKDTFKGKDKARAEIEIIRL